MLKNEYPVTYLRYMDDLDKMSDDKIKDILNGKIRKGRTSSSDQGSRIVLNGSS